MKRILCLLSATLIGVILAPLDACAGEWGVGVGIALHQPPHQGAEAESGVLPFPFYEGERLNIGFGSVSYGLMQSRKLRLAAEGQIRFEGYDPKETSELAGMAQRDPAFDVGFSIATGGLWGEAQVKILGDLTGTHEGYELSAAYQFPYQAGRWTLVPTLGLNWRSKKLVDYYYGVRVDEARNDRPSYSGRSTTNVFAGLTLDYELTSHLHILGGAQSTYLGKGIRMSPIVERNYEANVFSALLYRF